MPTPNGEQRRQHLSRRGLLGGALTAALTAVASAACADLTTSDRAGAAESSRGGPPASAAHWPPTDARVAERPGAIAPSSPPPASPPVSPPVTLTGAKSGSPGDVRPVRYHQPVYSLRDYVQMTPGAKHFPHHAVMLTIDDGPDPEWTPKILRLLDKHDVRATFCMIGCEAKAQPHLARAVATQGHHLANHTFTHPLSLPGMSLHRIRKEIDRTQDAVATATGVTPRLFRSPGGNWGPQIYRELRYHGLVPLDWDVDPRDWARPGTSSIVQAMLAAGPGDILLCHDGGGDRSETYNALRTVIPQLKARGLQFVTMPEHPGVAKT